MLIVNYSVILTEEKVVNQYSRKVPYEYCLTLMDMQTLGVQHFFIEKMLGLKLELGSRRCLVCLAPSTESPCMHCRAMVSLDENIYRTRQKCNYLEEDSPLVSMGRCTWESYPCGYSENRDICHSPYMLYIGRFNSLLKVGITKGSRGKYTRILEQGLNEAMAIHPIDGLPQALELEAWVSRHFGIPDKLTRDEKVRSFTERGEISWQKIVDWTMESGFSVDHFVMYPTLTLNQLQKLSLDENMVLEGLVIWIQGNWIVLAIGRQFYALDAKELIGYELRGFSTWEVS